MFFFSWNQSLELPIFTSSGVLRVSLVYQHLYQTTDLYGYLDTVHLPMLLGFMATQDHVSFDIPRTNTSYSYTYRL